MNCVVGGTTVHFEICIQNEFCDICLLNVNHMYVNKIKIGVCLISAWGWAWAPPTCTPLLSRRHMGPRFSDVAGGQDAGGRHPQGTWTLPGWQAGSAKEVGRRLLCASSNISLKCA